MTQKDRRQVVNQRVAKVVRAFEGEFRGIVGPKRTTSNAALHEISNTGLAAMSKAARQIARLGEAARRLLSIRLVHGSRNHFRALDNVKFQDIRRVDSEQRIIARAMAPQKRLERKLARSAMVMRRLG